MIFTASAGDNTWDKSCRPDATYGRADGWSLPRLTFLPGGGALESLLGGQSTFAGESITIIDYYYWLHSATIIYYYHRLLPRGGVSESVLDGQSTFAGKSITIIEYYYWLHSATIIDYYHRLLPGGGASESVLGHQDSWLMFPINFHWNIYSLLWGIVRLFVAKNTTLYHIYACTTHAHFWNFTF